MTTREAARIINAIKCSMVTTRTEHEALTMAECVLFEQERQFASVDAPVKHGLWIQTGQSFVFPKKFRNYFCSECGFELDKSIRTEYRYCPNCGADMQR